MKPIAFEAKIEAAERGGAFVYIPFEVEEVFGKKRVKIKAVFEDKVEYRGTLVRMGSPQHILIVRKDIRSQIGKQPGDAVNVSLEEDTQPRVVEVPEDFQHLLDQDEAVKQFFSKLSFTHQREYVEWITEAKKEETRQRRMLKAIEMLKQGKKGR